MSGFSYEIDVDSNQMIYSAVDTLELPSSFACCMPFLQFQLPIFGIIWDRVELQWIIQQSKIM